MGAAIIFLVDNVIGLAIFAIIASAVLSWLVAFNILNIRNPIAYQIVRVLEAVTSPLLRPIQRFLPNLGGVDLSPIVAFLLLKTIQIAVDKSLAPVLIGWLG
jgi:YggT family protein